jgi:hypothetical protein
VALPNHETRLLDRPTLRHIADARDLKKSRQSPASLCVHLTTTNSYDSVADKMGAAVSLPLLSFFALPALTSYGTSVNLLFFTLNWYILLLTHPPLQVELIGIALVQLLLYLLPALVFLLFDTGLPSVAVQIKSHGELALPGRKGRKQVAKIAAWSVFNVVLGAGLLGGIETLAKFLHVRTALSLSKTMPMPWAIMKSVALLLIIRGVSSMDRKTLC